MAPIPGSAPLLAEVLLVYSSLYLISSFTGCRGTVLLDSITGLPVIERSRWKMCVKSRSPYYLSRFMGLPDCG